MQQKGWDLKHLQGTVDISNSRDRAGANNTVQEKTTGLFPKEQTEHKQNVVETDCKTVVRNPELDSLLCCCFSS